MSSYKRATLEEEEVSDAPADSASSPDRVEVSECNTHIETEQKEFYTSKSPVVNWSQVDSDRFKSQDRARSSSQTLGGPD